MLLLLLFTLFRRHGLARRHKTDSNHSGAEIVPQDNHEKSRNTRHSNCWPAAGSSPDRSHVLTVCQHRLVLQYPRGIPTHAINEKKCHVAATKADYLAKE